jgi:ferritin-like metal-binding protein YciE
MEDVKARMLRYLVDAYAVEEGGLKSLQGISEETDIDEMRNIINEHITITQTQITRVGQRIAALGGDISKSKSLVNTIIGKASELANAFHDREDKLTQDLIKPYALEHFEVGMYTSMHAFAEEVGDHETAQLADAILAEEQLAAERVLRLIPQIAKTAVIRTNVYRTSP